MIGNHSKKPDMQTLWQFQPNEDRKSQSLLAIRQAVWQKRIQKQLSFTEKVWNQLRFRPWQHWAVHGCILLLAMLFILWFYKKELNKPDSIAACSVFFVFAGNIGLSSMIHLFSWHMAELEKTLYLDLKQMVCIQMLEAGIFDLLILGLLTGLLGNMPKHSLFADLLYLLVPFLWSEAFYLHMLTQIRSVLSGFWQLCIGIVCGVPVFFPLFWKNAYLPAHLLIWGILCAAGLALLTAEICRMMQKIDAGDLFLERV